MSTLRSYATHLRAGEITAKRISNTQLTYKITLTTYTDEVNGKPANDGQEEVRFYFGFATNKVEAFTVKRSKKSFVNSDNKNTVCNVYETTYTFPAAGRYTISCGIVNRNPNTKNLPQPSENISFFVSTTILINASFGLNSTPTLLNIPLDTAALGKKFIHNPGAFDIDGDSLSYKLTTPQRDKGVDTGLGEFIGGYLGPETVGKSPILNAANSGPATFKIDPRTGDLIWDAPREIGQYNVAFIVEEWRRAPDGTFIKIGEIVRDMQIIVVESDNNSPELTVPKDLCIEAGKKLEFEVSGKDKDDQLLTLTSSGGIYNLDATGKPFKFIEPEAATFKSKPTKKLVLGSFVWNTNCQHVRSQPYDVLFKVEDLPGRLNTQLVDIKTVKIKVLPPSVLGVLAKADVLGNKVSWKPPTSCKNQGKLLLYRKNGCSGLNSGECESGMPSEWGYTLISSLTLADSIFIDKTAEKGATYSYRLVTEVLENEFIVLKSGPSAEFCIGAEIKSGVDLMTKVSITETDEKIGKVSVAWTRPLDLDKSVIKPPYAYKLLRAKGISDENYVTIYEKITNLDLANDTTFTDENLNTKDQVYRYKVEFYSESIKLFSTSSVASSVRLNGNTDNKALSINWQANVPWTNENKVHLIYREDKNKLGSFNLIKKQTVSNVSTFNFKDTGKDEEKDDGDISTELKNGEKYCYYVQTVGSYEKYPQYGILNNNSQIFCLSPADNTPPCPATVNVGTSTTEKCAQLDSKAYCNENTFVNKFTWANPTAGGCVQDISGYNIYYARYEDETPKLIGSSITPTYTHRRNSKEGFAGCYTITSKNSFNIEGTASNKICFDNCDNIGFPNVFTPNGDNKNDTFSPLNCPAFVKNITYDIYNSQGLKVATGTGSELNWDGTDLNGNALASGVYYYVLTVDFEKLSRTGLSKSFKGYVSLLR